jgi:mannonate dehydratase
MRLATVLTPVNDRHLRLAAQCGVEELVVRYPGDQPGALKRAVDEAAGYGLSVSVVEGYLPIEKLKIGRDDGRQLAAMQRLMEQMSDCQVPLLCYNFMACTDWARTELAAPERGGARTTAFRLADAQKAQLLGYQASDPEHEIAAREETHTSLWQHLDHMMDSLLPVAERLGILMAMHPDDPPLPELLGKPRIMHSVESFQQLLQRYPSKSNRICFCQGTFAAMGCDIPTTIRMFGDAIAYVHFRDVRGTADAFIETFHDNGPTDMPAAMKTLWDVGFRGAMRPDHVPQLVGEEDGEPGYTILGRLFAWGYMRGLMHAVQSPSTSDDG